MSTPDQGNTEQGNVELPPAPAIQVLRGAADEVELAALVAGLSVQAAAAGLSDDDALPLAEQTGTHSTWADRRRSLRPTVAQNWAAGPGAWRWSGR